MNTQVSIIGGGPSGLLLPQLLHLKSINAVLLEKYSREYVLGRIRTGAPEHGFAKLIRETQCGERINREGEIHEGILIGREKGMGRIGLHENSADSPARAKSTTRLPIPMTSTTPWSIIIIRRTTAGLTAIRTRRWRG